MRVFFAQIVTMFPMSFYLLKTNPTNLWYITTFYVGSVNLSNMATKNLFFNMVRVQNNGKNYGDMMHCAVI